jgi:DNA adenine methylase/adenine-specific DNA-methyltransferase
LFSRFRNSIIVLSYSSNGFPDLSVLQELLTKYKSIVKVYSKPHRYHFGTHSKVQRAKVEEFLHVGY